MITLIILYVYAYYSKVTIDNIFTHIVVLVDIAQKHLNNFIEMFIDKDIWKIIIIAIAINIFIKELELKSWIHKFNSFQFKDFKVKQDVKLNNFENKYEESELHKENKVKDLEAKETTGYITKQALERLYIDKPFIVSIVDAVLNNNNSYLSMKSNISVNLNLIPSKLLLEDIALLFEYKLSANSIIITSFKPEVESMAIDVYRELLAKGIVYAN